MKSEDDNTPSEFIREITHAQSAIAAYVRSLLPTHPDYMDIVQEVNVTLWKLRGKYRLGSNFKAWAFKTARYHVMSARRKMAAEGKRLVFDEDLVELLAESTPFAKDPLERKLEALHQCLGGLREQDRAMLRMRYSKVISIETYARQQERNPATVRATLRRLREILLNCVTRKLMMDDLSLLDGKPT
jgi:RNA polymerase sigma-70 factor (ECF subfamily)